MAGGPSKGSNKVWASLGTVLQQQHRQAAPHSIQQNHFHQQDIQLANPGSYGNGQDRARADGQIHLCRWDRRIQVWQHPAALPSQLPFPSMICMEPWHMNQLSHKEPQAPNWRLPSLTKKSFLFIKHSLPPAINSFPVLETKLK